MTIANSQVLCRQFVEAVIYRKTRLQKINKVIKGRDEWSAYVTELEAKSV